MDIRQLEVFLAVMECSSVTRAAERIGLSPGAVSLQLQNLAAELRTDLFVRSGKHLAPTPAALRLEERARGVTRGMRQIQQEFAGDPSADARPFHFATGATSLIHHLGQPLRLLRKRFPQTPIQITVQPTEEMVEGLRDRRYDLALISLPYPHDDLTVLPLFEEELLLLRPSRTQVRRWHVGTLAAQELQGQPFVLYPKRSNMRTIIEAFFREMEVTPRVIMEADDTEVMKKLVESGFGYSMLPEYALHAGPHYYQIFRAAGKRVTRLQALAMVRSEYPRALTQSIAEFLEAAVEKQLAAKR
ncbi:MAG TPA: LysR family transcriptional regulator [Bryobacteraceae bacterium]|nr:LysR family transcriptional regulator [Bryobacteraceae bacterium]